MTSNTYVVIMAGGVGSRFWPYSRNARPKQFLDILGTGKSLLRMTFERFLRTTTKDNILVVTNGAYADLVHEHLPEIDKDQVLSEPNRRNTAPCIAYAAYKIYAKDPNAIIVVTPADHAIFQEERFSEIIGYAVSSAQGSERLLTVGIRPNRPETGYGYIQYMEEKVAEAHKVKTFTEKPELFTCQEIFGQWRFSLECWNFCMVGFDDR